MPWPVLRRGFFISIEEKMSKRFTCTMKWEKVWFRKLSPVLKCFWIYICDRCNHAGIWEVDFETASHFIGVPLDEELIRNEFKCQYKEIDNGKKWFIHDFTDFQYGTLEPRNRAHLSVISILAKEGLADASILASDAVFLSKEAPSKGLISPMLGCKDKDKDKDICISVKDLKDVNDTKTDTKHLEREEFDFEVVWQGYPRRLGRKDALRHFKASVKTQLDYENIKKALENYKQHLKLSKTEENFIKHGSSWFNNWSDWVDFKTKTKESTY